MLLRLRSSAEVHGTLANPAMLLLGDFDELEVISHNHSYSQENVSSTEMNVAGHA